LILGREELIPEEDVIGIFDLDNASWSYLTREYLAKGEKSGRVKNLSDGLPRSLVVTAKRDYLSQLTPNRIANRRI
jgi:hypothetical protein